MRQVYSLKEWISNSQRNRTTRRLLGVSGHIWVDTKSCNLSLPLPEVRATPLLAPGLSLPSGYL